MLPIGIEEAAALMEGKLITHGSRPPVRRFPSVSIDSRTVSRGEVFFAIRGPNLDGHRFIRQAIDKGVSAVVVSEILDLPGDPARLHVIQVSDTTEALQKLSASIRMKWGGKVLAITGSAGKTTTRRFIAELLKSSFRVHETSGNLNNQYGLPLSLLELNPEHEIAVLELGMNHSGEIGFLSQLCQPDFGLITNIAPVHLEFFSSIREIAEAKAELLEFLPENGHFFFNHDDEALQRISRRFRGEKTSFGLAESSDIRITDLTVHHIQNMSLAISGRRAEYRARSVSIGKPAAYNIAAAVAVAEFFKVPPELINQNISRLRPPLMRGEIHNFENNITVWNDTYNANPKAVEALLEILREIPSYKRKIVVLGDMLELGPISEQFHRNIGKLAAGSRLNRIITVGQISSTILESAIEAGFPGQFASHFENVEDAASFLSEQLEPGDLVAIKGSRGLRLEKIVKYLQETAA